MVPWLPTSPLFLGVPGGVELLVILLVALVVFGLPIVLIGGGLYLYRQTQSDRPANEEIEALREEVHRLREDVQQMNDDPLTDHSADEQSANERSNDDQ
jgi:sec-independent protein translocase protein TatA